MDSVTLCLSNLHEYGDLFSRSLAIRGGFGNSGAQEKTVSTPASRLPVAVDQYDHPDSSWITVYDSYEVLGGIRLTPTTARAGVYSYLLKDAQDGLFPHVPEDLLFRKAPVQSNIFEISKFYCAPHLTMRKGLDVKIKMMDELLRSARRLGATELYGLLPQEWRRWNRSLGILAMPAGPVVDFLGKEHQAVYANIGGWMN